MAADKVKAGGLEIVASYVFWIHHEEVQGCFDCVASALAAHLLLASEPAPAPAQGRLLAGIDVIHDEGHWPASPLAPHPGVLLTRHGFPAKTLPGVHGPPHLPPFAVQNLRAYREGGKLINVVTAEMYDLKT